MRLSIELSDLQLARLRERASQLGIQPEQLAQAAVSDLLETPDADFQALAERLLRDNDELYRRLATKAEREQYEQRFE